MAENAKDFTSILLRNQTLGKDQLDEGIRLAQTTGIKLQDALIKLNYATHVEVMSAIAEFHKLQFVDLTNIEISKAVIELVPESVARENVVLPLALEGNVLKIITSDPTNYDTIQKLTFILNKDVQPVLADNEQIREAINRHYGLHASGVHRYGHRIYPDGKHRQPGERR
jgi:type IV pilus assembly protein PilB